MILHEELGHTPFARIRTLGRLIREGKVVYAGNRKLKIYGTLRCSSGIRMKTSNRVFFDSGQEAIAQGYRPCGHCMKTAYGQWKDQQP